ncbi:MAG: hypothetical protein QOI88_1111 [Gammaproteobacteria bacterium]|jgi:hypothetical protein|nr:hypothetical protein [Gammaproteobacteria bacterium]
MLESNTQYWRSRVHGGWVRPFAKNFMRRVAASSVLSVLAALTLERARAVAQGTPRLNDNTVAGARNTGSSPTRSSAPVMHGPIWIPPSGGEYNGRSVVLTDSNGFTANAGFTTETTLSIGWRF